LRVDERNAETAGKGERCSLPVEDTIRRSDKVYRLLPRS
jgi:hypothetical protein